MAILPTLTEDGWITNSKSILEYLIEYYILSDAAQSISFQNHITNLAETYYRCINDPDKMAYEMKNDLDKLLSKYFQNVEVETVAKQLTGNKYAILLYVAVIDEEMIKTELARITEINTSGLRKIIAINNYGDGLNYLQAV